MSERFIKFIPCEEAMYLLRKHRNAFALLTFIAERARRENGHPDGLTIGQCYVGDWENMGLTRQEYRTALNILVVKKYVEITETCRTRKKSTTGTTTVSTLVKLISSGIYDINSEEPNQRINHRPTTDQPPTNHKQERIRKDISNDISKKEIAQPAARLRSKDSLTFNFQSFQFEGITEQDRETWKSIYPHIDVSVEILKAIEWLKANPTKSNKTQWRKFLTGWFSRTNISIENKKAFKAASGSQSVDRRLKDPSGNPVPNQYSGRF